MGWGGARIMRDDGICHHLHCPGKIGFDRATHGGACSVLRAGHRGGLADRILCDMCISRKSLTTNLSRKKTVKKNGRPGQLKGAGAFGPNAMRKHALLSPPLTDCTRGLESLWPSDCWASICTHLLQFPVFFLFFFDF